jgi:hypothetical protein
MGYLECMPRGFRFVDVFVVENRAENFVVPYWEELRVEL